MTIRLFLTIFILCVFFASPPVSGQENDVQPSKPTSEINEKDNSQTNVKNDEQTEKKKAEKANENRDSESESKKAEPSTESKDNDTEAKKGGETDKPEKEEPPKIGNFALPESQQPAALFGFGGNIINQGEVQLYFFADEFRGRRKVTEDMIPSVLFGITDEWSIFFNFPFTPFLRDGCARSKGLEDFFIQLEYAFYNKSTKTYSDQATLVTNITVPTGSIKKNPNTGFGAPSLFLGGTYYHVLVDWFAFTMQGAVLTASDHRTKIGDQFLYQFGFGRNIPSPKGWIFAWMLEVDGQYSKRNRIHGIIDRNSGGNVIYVTPSIWISSWDLLFQFGVSFPVNQNLFGHQRKFDYAFNFNFAWSFYPDGFKYSKGIYDEER